MSKNPYLSCFDGRHFVTQESQHRGFFGTTQDQIIARDDGIDIYNQMSHISLTWVESGAGKDKKRQGQNAFEFAHCQTEQKSKADNA